jgi:hypothetical protein
MPAVRNAFQPAFSLKKRLEARIKALNSGCVVLAGKICSNTEIRPLLRAIAVKLATLHTFALTTPFAKQERRMYKQHEIRFDYFPKLERQETSLPRMPIVEAKWNSKATGFLCFHARPQFLL